MQVVQMIQQFARDEEGANAIEYGLVAALIAVGLTVALGALEGSISGFLGKIGGKITATVA